MEFNTAKEINESFMEVVELKGKEKESEDCGYSNFSNIL